MKNIFRKKTEAERTLEEIGKSMAYSRKFLRDKSDEEIAALKYEKDNSLLRRLCKKAMVPVLGNFYEFEDSEIKLELMARDAVRRYEAGEAVCGITGF